MVQPSTQSDTVGGMHKATHCFRSSLFQRERCWSLDGDALLCSENGRLEGVPLRDVVRIRIYRVPPSIIPAMRRTILYLSTGDRVVLDSSHYARFGVIEDRGASYRSLIADVLRAISRLDPHVQVIVGPPLMLWLSWVVLLTALCIVVAFGVAVSFAGEFPMAGLFSFGIVIGFLPLAWKIVRRGCAHRVEVQSIPADVFE